MIQCLLTACPMLSEEPSKHRWLFREHHTCEQVLMVTLTGVAVIRDTLTGVAVIMDGMTSVAMIRDNVTGVAVIIDNMTGVAVTNHRAHTVLNDSNVYYCD